MSDEIAFPHFECPQALEDELRQRGPGYVIVQVNEGGTTDDPSFTVTIRTEAEVRQKHPASRFRILKTSEDVALQS